MSEHPIVPGDKLHVITRRLFPDDLRRHFVGEVKAVAGSLCEVEGYVFVFQSGKYQKRMRPRLRVLSVADAGHIVNKIPRDVDIQALEYRFVDDRLVVTDLKDYELDVNEFGPMS